MECDAIPLSGLSNPLTSAIEIFDGADAISAAKPCV
jgi:hypothetical protein